MCDIFVNVANYWKSVITDDYSTEVQYNKVVYVLKHDGYHYRFKN